MGKARDKFVEFAGSVQKHRNFFSVFGHYRRWLDIPRCNSDFTFCSIVAATSCILNAWSFSAALAWPYSFRWRRSALESNAVCDAGGQLLVNWRNGARVQVSEKVRLGEKVRVDESVRGAIARAGCGGGRQRNRSWQRRTELRMQRLEAGSGSCHGGRM